VVLCTDDSGVFSTSLSREYAIAAGTFKLDKQQLTELAMRSIDYTFLPQDSKEVLRKQVASFAEGLSRT
jgi:adenosine deaminase